MVSPTVLQKIFTSIDAHRFLSSCVSVQILLKKNDLNICITLVLYSIFECSICISRGKDIEDRNFKVFFPVANLKLYK